MKKTGLLLTIFLSLTASVFGNEIKQIKSQFLTYFVQKTENEIEFQSHLDEILFAARNEKINIKSFLDKINDDGSWSDINYIVKRKASWEGISHQTRLLAMATGYVGPKSEFYHDPTIKKAIINGLTYWTEHNYRNSNWWHTQIGVPEHMLLTMLLMGDDLPVSLINKADATVFKPCKMGMTGQNKVWRAGVAFMRALLLEDTKTMRIASDAIWSELIVSTKEGIQPDWSFHQHGPQQQLGNYGRSFGRSMVMWASVLKNTSYAASSEKIEILRNYQTKGAAWVLWKNTMDFSTCGRQFTHESAGYPPRNYKDITQQIRFLSHIDPKHKSEYKQSIAWPNQLIGHTSFWSSDFAVHRRPAWYSSVKMCSKRVIGIESGNGENMQGLHNADGVCLVYQSGEEYDDIFPVWDWKRLPGTTCDQKVSTEKKSSFRNKSYGLTDFAGVLNDGTNGIAAMTYKRHALSAHKAWFMLEESIVCLGTDIQGETKGAVYTSVEQSLLTGDVTSSSGKLKSGELHKSKNKWIHHNNIGYQIGNSATVHLDTVSGNWLRAYPEFSNRPVTKDVFSIWIDHGKNPKSESYNYVIYPDAKASEMNEKIKKSKSKILSNTKTVQAIQNKNEILAVFYKEGKLKVNKKTTIEVDTPCLLILTEKQIYVSDPVHTSIEINIKINKQKYLIVLPKAKEKGMQTIINRN